MFFWRRCWASEPPVKQSPCVTVGWSWWLGLGAAGQRSFWSLFYWRIRSGTMTGQWRGRGTNTGRDVSYLPETKTRYERGVSLPKQLPISRPVLPGHQNMMITQRQKLWRGSHSHPRHSRCQPLQTASNLTPRVAGTPQQVRNWLWHLLLYLLRSEEEYQSATLRLALSSSTIRVAFSSGPGCSQGLKYEFRNLLWFKTL